MAWPDIVLAVVLLFGALRGWRVGLIAELTGTLALLAAIMGGFTYPGMWDRGVANTVHLGPGSAHVLALLLYAGAWYVVVSAVGFALGRVAKLPIINIANAALGSLLGLGKAAIFVWVVVYIALFFPLSDDLRRDLNHSHLVALLASHNEGLDGTLRSQMPWFVRPYSEDVFNHHNLSS